MNAARSIGKRRIFRKDAFIGNNMSRIIHLISGPRNVSTALMYAFARRADTRVVDEPFYGHYLRQTGLDHPGREDVLAAQPHNAEEIQAHLLAGTDRPILFVKNMAHHLAVMDPDFIRHTEPVFLIRDPAALIISLAKVLPVPTVRDTGLEASLSLFRWSRDVTGRRPPVLDAGRLLADPEGVLQRLCHALEIPWDPAMLSWPAGGIPEDGVWASYWYGGVHRSTGFAAPRSDTPSVPEAFRDLHAAVLPAYRELLSFAL